MITKFRNAWYVEFEIRDWRGRPEIAQRHFKTKREAEAHEVWAARDLAQTIKDQAEERAARVREAHEYLRIRVARKAEAAKQGAFAF